MESGGVTPFEPTAFCGYIPNAFSRLCDEFIVAKEPWYEARGSCPYDTHFLTSWFLDAARWSGGKLDLSAWLRPWLRSKALDFEWTHLPSLSTGSLWS